MDKLTKIFLVISCLMVLVLFNCFSFSFVFEIIKKWTDVLREQIIIITASGATLLWNVAFSIYAIKLLFLVVKDDE